MFEIFSLGPDAVALLCSSLIFVTCFCVAAVVNAAY
jgi:hypothetical protein